MPLHLPKYKRITLEHALTKYMRPKYVYIPLISAGDTNITILVQKDDYVNKGGIIARRKGAFKIPIVSSVSGIVAGFEEHMCYTGEKVKCIKIENDFKDLELDLKKNKKLADISKKEFIELIKEKGIIGEGGAGFPTYAKYESKRKINTLIVNAVECEPYVTADQEVCLNFADEILETIDAILEINEIEEAFIAVNKTDREVIEEFNNHIGTYLKIKLFLVDDLYPMGWERMLVEAITHETYKDFPTEIGVIVNNVSTIYAIYGALKYNRALTERMITFTGNMLKAPQNIVVKIGTPVKKIIESIEGYKRAKDIILIAGGPMTGKALPDDDLIVTPNMNCVLVLRNQANEVALPCIRCGKCISVCPAKLSPIIIKDNLKNIELLKKLKADKCVECGSCSYICPSGLKLRECVKLAKSRIEGVKK